MQINYENYFSKHVEHELHGQGEEIVSVVFESKHLLPIKEINLNKLGQKEKHSFAANSVEFLAYEVSFVDLKRILTVRTQFLIINQTLETFELLLKSSEEDKPVTKIKIAAG